MRIDPSFCSREVGSPPINEDTVKLRTLYRELEGSEVYSLADSETEGCIESSPGAKTIALNNSFPELDGIVPSRTLKTVGLPDVPVCPPRVDPFLFYSEITSRHSNQAEERWGMKVRHS